MKIESLKRKLSAAQIELQSLFPIGNIELLHGQNNDYDDYMLLIKNGKQRIGFLLMRCYAEEEILEIQLFEDNKYQLNYDICGCQWVNKKPDNYQQLEIFIKHIWEIFNQ